MVASDALGSTRRNPRKAVYGGRHAVALQQLASAARATFGESRAPVWGKAANRRGWRTQVSKTTTKEILAALLAARFGVLKTQGNLNNEYGLPLTLLKLRRSSNDAAVVELGMSHPGELALLTKIASPDVGVVTRVAVEHLEFFASVDQIALAERELIENLPWPHAVAVLNADDERVKKFAEVARGRVIFFGESPAAEFRAEAIVERGLEGSAFYFISPSGKTRLYFPLIGRHNVMRRAGCASRQRAFGA